MVSATTGLSKISGSSSHDLTSLADGGGAGGNEGMSGMWFRVDERISTRTLAIWIQWGVFDPV